MIYVFSGLDSITPEIYESWLAKATKQRREKALKYRNYKDRLLCVVAYRLLCFALDCNCAEFTVDALGKPSLSGGARHFNLSHCDSLVACVVADSPVGIDAEPVKSFPNGVMKRVFTAKEREIIADSGEPDRAAVKLWTLKESYIKATGAGLSQNMFDVEFSLNCGEITCSDNRFRFSSYDLREHIVSSCGEESYSLRIVKPEELITEYL